LAIWLVDPLYCYYYDFQSYTIILAERPIMMAAVIFDKMNNVLKQQYLVYNLVIKLVSLQKQIKAT